MKSVPRQEKSVSAPKLLDLTILQREANRLFGYIATQTLNAVQNLYEQKIATYPRTDSRFITENMAAAISALVRAFTSAALAQPLCVPYEETYPQAESHQACSRFRP